MRTSPSHFGPRIEKACVLAALGRPAEALEVLDPLTRASGRVKTLVAWIFATSPYASLRDPSRAAALATEALAEPKATRRDLAETWLALGAARCRAEEWEGAAAALEQSVDLDPDGGARACFFAAIANHGRGLEAEAGAWLDRGAAWVAEHAPWDAELARLRAEAAAALGRGPR